MKDSLNTSTRTKLCFCTCILLTGLTAALGLMTYAASKERSEVQEKLLTLQQEYNALQAESILLTGDLDDIQQTIQSQEEEIAQLQEECAYFESNFGFVTESGSKYHTYHCRYRTEKSRVLSLSQCQAEGYLPCQVCHHSAEDAKE